jgi:hypothetical protein
LGVSLTASKANGPVAAAEAPNLRDSKASGMMLKELKILQFWLIKGCKVSTAKGWTKPKPIE